VSSIVSTPNGNTAKRDGRKKRGRCFLLFFWGGITAVLPDVGAAASEQGTVSFAAIREKESL
jgi:hypothetical protein